MNPRLTALLLLAIAPVARAATAPDSATSRVGEAIRLKARIEQRIASGLARGDSTGTSAHAAAHDSLPATAHDPTHSSPPASTQGSGSAASRTIRARRAVTPSPRAAATGTAALAANTTPGAVWSAMLEGNARFVSGRTRVRSLAEQRAELAGGQHPAAIVLGCSDSRVSPELVFDQSLGDLFVVRAAGNVADALELGSVEYAVDHLRARLIVVLGHDQCGAVGAAAAPGEPDSPNLRALVDRIRPVVQRLSNCFAGDELIERSVTANAKQSAADLLANSELLRRAAADSGLKVVSAVYDLRSGTVRELR